MLIKVSSKDTAALSKQVRKLPATGTFTTIDFPGSTSTFGGYINAEGGIVGAYTAAGVTHSFLLSNGIFTSFDPPGAVGFSDAAGINPSGVIVACFSTLRANAHGYIRTS